MLEAGHRHGVASFAAFLATAQVRAGDAVAEALETVEQALTDFDEPVFRPEALRIRGELRLKQAETELAAADFQEAIALARRMGAKSFELRATMSLAQMLDRQGRRDEARTMLANIYNWFTEGFDTADLKDAKVLLDELGN
jgi:predicted ATPase